MPTKRFCLAIDLKDDPQLIAEYEYYHSANAIWPEIIAGNKACGILAMDIYRIGNRLFMVMETVADFDLTSGFAKLITLPRQNEWATLMLKYQQRLLWAKPGEHWALMEHIFTQN